MLHNGHLANAVVWKHFMDDGRVVVEKDFSSRPWFVRDTVGRSLVRREVRFLRMLAPLGVAPPGVVRLGPFSMAEDFCEGATVRQMIARAAGFPVAGPPSRPSSADAGAVAFLEGLEDAVMRVHSAGIVHLDLHNARNIICGPDGRCVIIDWQSAARTARLPAGIRRLLEAIDLAGVYKHWEKLCPGTLGPDRERILAWETRRRRLWPLRGLKIDAPAVRGG